MRNDVELMELWVDMLPVDQAGSRFNFDKTVIEGFRSDERVVWIYPESIALSRSFSSRWDNLFEKESFNSKPAIKAFFEKKELIVKGVDFNRIAVHHVFPGRGVFPSFAESAGIFPRFNQDGKDIISALPAHLFQKWLLDDPIL
jgi:hypothetical protein